MPWQTLKLMLKMKRAFTVNLTVMTVRVKVITMMLVRMIVMTTVTLLPALQPTQLTPLTLQTVRVDEAEDEAEDEVEVEDEVEGDVVEWLEWEWGGDAEALVEQGGQVHTPGTAMLMPGQLLEKVGSTRECVCVCVCVCGSEHRN